MSKPDEDDILNARDFLSEDTGDLLAFTAWVGSSDHKYNTNFALSDGSSCITLSADTRKEHDALERLIHALVVFKAAAVQRGIQED